MREQYHKITILTENKLGVSSARNKGIKKSINQWIALLDSDDAWHPRKLEIQTRMLDSALKEYNLIHTDEVWFRNNKHINQMKKHKKQGGYIFERCLSLCCISPSSVMFKKIFWIKLVYLMKVCQFVRIMTCGSKYVLQKKFFLLKINLLINMVDIKTNYQSHIGEWIDLELNR